MPAYLYAGSKLHRHAYCGHGIYACKRRLFKEILLFKDVLREGVEKGVFRIDDIDMTAELVHYCVKGIEVPYIRGHIGAKLDDETRDKYVVNLVFGALHRT